MNDEPQDIAESLDEEVIDDDDDLSGDEFGEALPDYPPDRPLGVNTVGVTAVEEDAGESFAERTEREEPEFTSRDRASDAGREVGQLVDESATTEDDEEQLVGEAEPATELAPEEQAMHAEEGR